MKDKDDLTTNRNTDAEEVEDLPQEITESYGTGVKAPPELNIGIGDETTPTQLAEYTITTPGLTAADEDAVWGEADNLENEGFGSSPTLTGGDIDAAWDQAGAVGDEAVGGTVATPDQSVVDELGAAVGLEMADQEYVHSNEVLESRDDRRWELEPMSSEDYQDRRE